MSLPDVTSQYALDIARLGQLSTDAKNGNYERSLRETAKQFEAIFLGKMLSTMRDAYLKSDLGRSNHLSFYESMMDKQWAQHLSERGIGLADMLVEQLTYAGSTVPAGRETLAKMPSPRAAWQVRSMGMPASIPEPVEPIGPLPMDAVPSAGDDGESPDAFVDRITPYARSAARESGIPSELIVAQAILETGWGRRRIERSDGSDGHNIFGIKADPQWRGERVTVETHEYIGGRRAEVNARFRVYQSLQAAFQDYARIMGESDRYERVRAAESLDEAVQALSEAGYATDPAYADKLRALIDQGLRPRSSRS
ncbi:flagellar rod assembly protein/muramidase FlgJ [Halioglobus japonicus]|uniref:Peptidoglycan hydrolase FlgJ n=1 Tax=Halioglobus japonicus TaxID=930805 RepID=A0AAP8MEJ6_9GAMM|nr:flagellar assembly peptidoglycan hydrolase FlgJ [Halioglobus japonicus]AQA18086.1 flagellar rod assembly protein/muramidase FlgJ [Halioglobus japonicus]PLW86077.1 flagellar assembly peptidoglycan hydrolase FlgJ [Halioglobus japonicus]GHD14601.1 flagellar rod assembly protein/muramidase FlgJ [Halioglobus japonicus]